MFIDLSSALICRIRGPAMRSESLLAEITAKSFLLGNKQIGFIDSEVKTNDCNQIKNRNHICQQRATNTTAISRPSRQFGGRGAISSSLFAYSSRTVSLHTSAAQPYRPVASNLIIETFRRVEASKLAFYSNQMAIRFLVIKFSPVRRESGC